MIPWCRLCRKRAGYNLGRDSDPPPLAGASGGSRFPTTSPSPGKGVWPCIPKMGREVHEPLLELAERKVHRGTCALATSNLG